MASAPALRLPSTSSAMRQRLSTATAFSALSQRRLFRFLPFSGRPATALLTSSSTPSSPASTITATQAPSLRSRPGATHPQSLTTLPEANLRNLPQVWFNSTFPTRSDSYVGSGPRPDGEKPPDERTVKLALRILQERLPTLLQTPLPSDILSPTISLHLFPSTHPHLPVVSGRVAYIAALWTSPLAWNRVPLVGNVKLEILSERMTKHSPLAYTVPGYQRRIGAGDEQLVVRWRTVGGGAIPAFFKSIASSARAKAAEKDERERPSSGPVGTSQAVDDPNEFTGLFIFEFDGEGRILSHTIEHVAESGEWERSVGARFVGLTDWLLGGIKGGGGENPVPAFEMQDPRKLR